MKLFEILDSNFGKAFGRISRGLKENAPDWVTWVDRQDDADFVVLHTVGGKEYEVLQTLDLSKTVNIQHCVFTTWMDISVWDEVWKECYLNVSFHDLQSYTDKKINSLRIPWGADINTFVNLGMGKNIDVFVTGHIAETESIDLVFEACKRNKKLMYHTGHNFKYQLPYYRFSEYLSDDLFVKKLNQSRFTSCLRKIEGFELMGIEGALCGAVPLVPRLPTYDFYEGFGEFIDMDGDIVEQVSEKLCGNYFMTEDKIKFVRDKFSWQTISNQFYNALR